MFCTAIFPYQTALPTGNLLVWFHYLHKAVKLWCAWNLSLSFALSAGFLQKNCWWIFVKCENCSPWYPEQLIRFCSWSPRISSCLFDTGNRSGIQYVNKKPAPVICRGSLEEDSTLLGVTGVFRKCQLNKTRLCVWIVPQNGGSVPYNEVARQYWLIGSLWPPIVIFLPFGFFCLFMVALCNRADHYIFILFLSFFFFFPRLISAWEIGCTSTHGVALVRI